MRHAKWGRLAAALLLAATGPGCCRMCDRFCGDNDRPRASNAACCVPCCPQPAAYTPAPVCCPAE